MAKKNKNRTKKSKKAKVTPADAKEEKCFSLGKVYAEALNEFIEHVFTAEIQKDHLIHCLRSHTYTELLPPEAPRNVEAWHANRRWITEAVLLHTCNDLKDALVGRLCALDLYEKVIGSDCYLTLLDNI